MPKKLSAIQFVFSKVAKKEIRMKNFLVLNRHMKLFSPRRVGRVVDCGSLENCCTERYLGFESLTLRTNKGLYSLREMRLCLSALGFGPVSLTLNYE